jgi:polysaccharide export outer membrane protein
MARLGLITLGLLGALALGASSAGAQAAPDYRIGIDDVLAIYVWDNKDTDQTVFVRPDGKISLPLAGEVEVRGMTVADLETRLTELYQRTIKAARVTVIVKEIRSRPVFFIGGVGRTGPMQLTQEWTLLQAVSAAGGLLPQADLEAAYVLREGRMLQVNFDRLIQQGDITQNIKVQPGDVIVVPLAEQVFVEGDVKKPGAYKYTRDLTLFEVITQAGGFPDLSVPRRVTLVRTDGVKKETIELNATDMVKATGGATGDIKLRPKDLVVVTIADLVYVQGEVKAPTTLKYTTDLTLLKAIAHTGGFTPLAAGNRVVLVRGTGAKRENVRVNVDDMLKGSAPDIALSPNDIVIVPQRLF